MLKPPHQKNDTKTKYKKPVEVTPPKTINVKKISTSEYLTIRGLRYHIRHWGENSYPKLFLLHGWNQRLRLSTVHDQDYDLYPRNEDRCWPEHFHWYRSHALCGNLPRQQSQSVQSDLRAISSQGARSVRPSALIYPAGL